MRPLESLSFFRASASPQDFGAFVEMMSSRKTKVLSRAFHGTLADAK